jgi:hypothetical protein
VASVMGRQAPPWASPGKWPCSAPDRDKRQ